MEISEIMNNINGYLAAGGIGLGTALTVAVGFAKNIKNKTNTEIKTLRSENVIKEKLRTQAEQKKLKFEISVRKRELALKEISVDNKYLDETRKQMLIEQIAEIKAEIGVLEADLLPEVKLTETIKKGVTNKVMDITSKIEW